MRISDRLPVIELLTGDTLVINGRKE